MGALISLLGGGLLKSALGFVTAIFGDRAARDRGDAGAQAAAMEQFAAEFQYRGPRSIFDILIDALNRLPRPFMTFGVIALFVWAVRDPHEFSVAMLALQVVPEQLWWLMGVVTIFWFGSRLASSLPMKYKGPSLKDVQVMRDLDAESRYQESMNSTKPLTNEAILEWNRRKGLR